jgi:hypothetical protein
MRDQIINEIRRLTKASDGRVPGRQMFELETGIRESAWRGVYWARWGDAVAEAGFQPNTLQGKLDEVFFFRKLVEALRHFGRIPTTAEMRLYGNIDTMFPAHSTIDNHFRTKENMLDRLASWVGSNEEYSDIADMLGARPRITQPKRLGASPTEGFVYLIKSGSHYKIGRSDELERRVKEIRLALPDVATLVHSIRTDDPPGIEAYWHKRFANCRVNGEWFKLAPADVAAFKRRKYR